MNRNSLVSQRAVISLAVLVFAVTLGAVVGNRLVSTNAMAIALGVSVGAVAGIATGVIAALFVLRQRPSDPTADPTRGMTSIVLSADQAERLLQMLNSRRQASPDLFPLTAAHEREFTVVGGASLNDQDDPQP